MQVTKIDFDNYHPKDRGTCAEVSVTLDDCLVIHRVQVISGEKGMFIAMPNTGMTKLLDKKKRYTDLVHPTSKKLSDYIKNEVLNAYSNYVQE